MSYFTESQLRGYAHDKLMKLSSDVKTMQFHLSSTEVKTAFLSHSHKDKELAEGMKNHLHNVGFDLYIDWQDSSMPSTTNAETAKRIKDKIGASDIILVLATKNAMESKWVPWEIGIGDEKKGTSKVLIIPVQDANGRFHGNEYIQLYDRIEIAEDGVSTVFIPEYKYVGSTLSDYSSKI